MQNSILNTPDKKQKYKKLKPPTFSKQQFLQSEEYSDKKNIIDALLEPNLLYSKQQVDKIIKSYLEGEI